MPVKFEATVVKHTSMGNVQRTLPFMAWPKDSVLTRTISYKKDGDNPQCWFTEFRILSSGTSSYNDPNVASNWKKGLDGNGKPYYTFIIAE